MRLRIPALVAVALLVTACLDPLPVPTGRYGAITAPTFARTGGGYAMRPQAAFYGRTDLSYVPFVGDTCLITAYADSSLISGGLNFLNAGDFLQTSVSGRVDTLTPPQNLNLHIYTFPIVTGIPFTPGDTLSVVVPGANFPAGSVRVRTVEPFDHSAIPVPGLSEGINVTWDAAVSSGSRMNFSLRYNNGFITTGHNEQLFCSFTDDGAASIPSLYLDGWRNALNDERETYVTRIRSTEVEIDTRTKMVLISTFSRPLATASIPTLR